MEPEDNSVVTQVAPVPAPEQQDNQDKKNEDKDDLLAKAERYKQQLRGSTEEAKRLKEEKRATELKLVNKEVKLVDGNNAYFLELADEDPEVADRVAERYGFSSAREFAEKLKWNEEAPSENRPAFIDEDALYAKFKTRMQHEEAIDTVSSVLGKLGNEEDREAAHQEFERITNGRKLTPAEARKYAEMAVLYTKREDFYSGRKDAAIASMASAGIGRVAPSANQHEEKSQDVSELEKLMGL